MDDNDDDDDDDDDDPAASGSSQQKSCISHDDFRQLVLSLSTRHAVHTIISDSSRYPLAQ